MKFNKKVLDNGLTILHEKRDVPVTTVMLSVKYGSAYETEAEKGMAHFMEHLCFKGTEKRTVNQIAEEVEKVGGILNAFTSEEITAYHVKLPSEHLEIATDVIFDVFFNASFPEEEVAKEAKVICEEIKMYRDNPRAHVFEKIKNSLYEKPFGLFIAGSEEGVCCMSRKMLFDKHRQMYVPKNSVLTVVGNNDFEEVVKFAEKFSVEREGNIHEIPEIKKRILRESEKRDSLNQSNLALGVHFPLMGDKDRYSAEIFSTILGQGMSSKLFREVREKRGLVYGVKTDFDSGKNYGYLVIWAGTDPGNIEEVEKVCLDEFSKMGQVTLEELEAAKIQVIGNRHVGDEGSSDVAVGLTFEEFSESAENYYKYPEKINEVTLEDVRSFAEKTEFARFSLGP